MDARASRPAQAADRQHAATDYLAAPSAGVFETDDDVDRENYRG